MSCDTCAQEVSFSRDVAPLVLRRCAGCHGGKIAEGGLRLHTFDFMMEAGDSGETTIVPGDPDASEFYHRLVESDVDLRMPQEDDPLDDVEIAVLR